jgi:LuxR family maltose regulon positive regulatory protein
MAAWQVRIWLAQDRLDAASQWVVNQGPDVDGELTYQNEREYIALARILIAQEQLDEAIGLLQRLFEAAEIRGHASRGIESLTLQALAFQAGGDMDQAISSLERALTLAEPAGYFLTFVDEGLPMSSLLHEALNRGIAPEYVQRLLVAFSSGEIVQAEQTKSPPDQSELVELLSERELEVLQRIAEGLTNREIATKLFLSLNTVKAHTRNIYGKLGVNNRTQAAAKARDLGILPPN